MFTAFLFQETLTKTFEAWRDTLFRQGQGLSLMVVHALLLLVIGHWVSLFLVRNLGKVLEHTSLDPTVRKFFCNVLRAFLFIVIALAVLQVFGVATTSLVAAIAAMGAAVALALQGSLSSFAAGILIVALRPFKVDDTVEVGGISGNVEEIGILSVRLRTGDNRIIIVPNSSFISQTVTNVTARPVRRVDLTIGIGYGDQLDTAREIIGRVLAEDGRVLKAPGPLIAVTELGESSVNMAVRPWVRTGDYWAVRFDLLEKLKVELEKGGCTIPFPQRELHVRQK